MTIRDRALIRATKTHAWGGASFYRRLLQRRRVHYQARGEDKRPIRDWETKAGVKALAARHDVPTARTLQTIPSLDALDVSALPDEFAIKPNWGAGADGVLVLRRYSGGLIELLSGERVALEDLQGFLQRRLEAVEGRWPDFGLLAEESLATDRDAAPYDWKFFTFRGQIPLCLQIARRNGKMLRKFYDASWRDLGAVRVGQEVESSLPPPTVPDGLLDAAKRMSMAIPTGFVRVDLYEHRGRAVLGEVAVRPGGPQLFRRGLDRALGEEWDTAEAELIASGSDLIP